MAIRDRDWPGYTMWFCCGECGRLWTLQGDDVVALDPRFALGPAISSDYVQNRTCAICEGKRSAPTAEI